MLGSSDPRRKRGVSLRCRGTSQQRAMNELKLDGGGTAGCLHLCCYPALLSYYFSISMGLVDGCRSKAWWTLDRVPVPDLEVVFWPVGGGHASLGYTYGNGKYESVPYKPQIKGVLIVRYRVTITPLAWDGKSRGLPPPPGIIRRTTTTTRPRG